MSAEFRGTKCYVASGAARTGALFCLSAHRHLPIDSTRRAFRHRDESAPSWPDRSAQAAAAGLTGEGWDIGETPPNDAMVDQNQTMLNLHQFYGYKVVLVLHTVWNVPSQTAASTAQALWAQYKDDGVIFIDVLLEGSTPEVPATISDQEDWASVYRLQYPVTAQSTYPLSQLPTYVLIDTTMTVSDVIEGFGGDEFLSERNYALLP